MSKWTCAGCGLEVIDCIKTCACDTMVMCSDDIHAASEWMHLPSVPSDLELAILECRSLDDFLTVQKTVSALSSAPRQPAMEARNAVIAECTQAACRIGDIFAHDDHYERAKGAYAVADALAALREPRQ